MFNSNRLLTIVSTAVGLSLAGCGGGSSNNGAPTENQVATINGTAAGEVSSVDTNVGGSLGVTDPDPGQATFAMPANLWGTYGYWTFNIDGASATWSYTVQTSTLPSLQTGQTLSESLNVSSLDGSAVETLQVTITEPKADSSLTAPPLPALAVPPTLGYGASSPELQVLNYLNNQRLKCGFGLLAQDAQLDKAAAAHARYSLINNHNSHSESVSGVGFTGANPSDRMAAAGYSAWSSSEAISYRYTALAGIRDILSAPYHAATAMFPFRDVGISFQSTDRSQLVMNALVLDYGVKSSVAKYQSMLPKTLLTFPCEGSSDLAPSFYEAENWQAPTGVGIGGTPLVIMAPNFEAITVSSAELSTVNGTVIPTAILTSKNDPQKIFSKNPNIVLAIPPSALQPRSAYKWSISGTIAGTPFTRSFSFTTGAHIE